jgi:hypothetical protein
MSGEPSRDDDVLVVELERAGASGVIKARFNWRERADSLGEIKGGQTPANWAEAASAMCFLWETLLAQGLAIELVDDEGVFHVIPAAAVSAIRCYLVGSKPGNAEMARHYGFRQPRP